MAEANRAQYQRTHAATSARHTAYHAAHREAYREQYAAKPKHGMTRDEKSEWLDALGWRCQICETPFDSLSAAHVDHDHSCCPGPESCGACVRGFLCGSCNRALGMFHDDVDVLRRAIWYLDTYRAATPSSVDS